MNEQTFQVLSNCVKELYQFYKDVDNQGKCFEIAFGTFVFLAERGIFGTLVHANITMGNKILGHAWIEYSDIVIDLTLPSEEWIQRKNEYHEIAQIQKIVKYNGNEIQDLISKYGEQVVWEDWIIYKDD
ncbi:MAG: lasso peptide biosynthesis protein [Sulfurimonas sp.]|nr:lasso peptide biosynthesis protein [Sulfurimonas sp.]